MPTQFTTDLPDESPATITVSNSNTINVEKEVAPSNYGDVRAQLIDPSNNVLEQNVLSRSATTTSFSPLADGARYFVRTRTETEHVNGSWATAVKDIGRASASSARASVTAGGRSMTKSRNGLLSSAALTHTNTRSVDFTRNATTTARGAAFSNSIEPLSKSRRASASMAPSGPRSTGSIFREVFPSENSDDLDFDFVFDPVLAFASEWVDEETVFGPETDAFTVILDAKINDYMTVRIQYREDDDSDIYTTEPRTIRRNGEPESFDELGNDGQYRLLLSDMTLNDHLRAVTWGPTRF